ncbi:MAG: calcium/sodium antiporter [Myxococcota bacterium]
MQVLYVTFQLVLGVVLLTVGANVFVDGASGLARRLSVPPMVIGLTVVALGTSAPEIGVNVVAAFSGQPGLAVGNVVGSNILNIFIVLGISAMVAPLVVHASIIRLDVAVMVGSAAVLWIFAADGRVSSLEAALFVLALAVYSTTQVMLARRTRIARDPDDDLPPERPLYLQLGAILLGSGMLVFGSDALVAGATTVALGLGIPDRIIGLTVVAIGTSLPELAASLTATLKGERDLAVGNVLGSNIYNVLAVVGLTGLIARGGIEVSAEALAVDFPVMLGASLACVPIFFVGNHIARWEGTSFVFYYLLYLLYLVLSTMDASAAPLLARWSPVIVGAVILASTAQWARIAIRSPSPG